MKLSTLVFSIAALGAGAVLAYPHVQASPLKPDAAPTPCKTSSACFTETNHGAGSALKGVSLAVKTGAFGSGAIVARADGLGGVYSYSKQFYGGEFENGGAAGTYALIAATDNPNGIAFVAEGPAGAAYIDAAGNVFATDYYILGSPTGASTYAAYAAAGTIASIEDTGSARLVNGAGIVRFDSTFAEAVDVRNGYEVFLNADGPVRAPLYVAQKFARGFTVRESGDSRSSVAFDYRVVARRAGSSDVRLPEITLPRLPHTIEGER